jgi:TolB-like protein/Flp pilus assembly protein TadD
VVGPDGLVAGADPDTDLTLTRVSDVPSSLGPFDVVRKIGAGGMGEVFLARDPRLDREVAVKVLPADLTQDPDRRTRFLREARAAAALNHPNITTIHEIGEMDGRDYIAFELVDGKTLQAVLDERKLPLTEIVDLALPLADALSYAHEEGVVHRDLKVANVMVTTRGLPKLLDFGLAKLTQEDSRSSDRKKSTTLTMTGAVFGTPNAMSPEQALGRPVDERSDVFSFGSLLYEMASGRPPFERETVMETVNAVIQDEPEDLGRLRKDLPVDFLTIVAKALRKDAGERYQHMSDLAADLRHFKRSTESGLVPPGSTGSSSKRMLLVAAVVTVIVIAAVLRELLGGGAEEVGAPTGAAPAVTVAEQPVAPSVAVLPFTTLSTTEEDRVFVSGMHDDVLTQVAKIGALKVISRTSMMEYADTTKSIPTIGSELGVAAVLEGSVQRAGDAVRVNLKLIDAATEENLWAESYNRELTARNVFAIQAEIAHEIARALETTLSPDEEKRLARMPTQDMEAYEAFLVADAAERGTIAVEQKGEIEGLYRRAVELDPEFALAHARLGAAIGEYNWMTANDPAEWERARASVQRALDLDPDLPEAHQALGQLYYTQRDYARAEEEYAIAARGIPNDVELLFNWMALLRRIGRWEESLAMLEEAIPLDPLNSKLCWEAGITKSFLGRNEAAEQMLDRAIALNPDSETAKIYRMINELRADVSEAELERIGRDLAAIDDNAAMSVIWTFQALLQTRDYDLVLGYVDDHPGRHISQWSDYPVELMRGVTLRLAGREVEARVELERAREHLEAVEAPDMRTHCALGVVYAELDRPEDAVREGRRSLELLPYERDSIVHQALRWHYAYVLVRVGELEGAVEELRTYLSRPGLLSIEGIVRDPRFDALKELESFQELVEEARR